MFVPQQVNLSFLWLQTCQHGFNTVTFDRENNIKSVNLRNKITL